MNKIVAKLDVLLDVFGNKYIGVKIPKEKLILNEIATKIDNFETCNEKLLVRNHDSYHITVFNVAECNSLNINVDLFVKQNINNYFLVELSGVGSISKNDKTTYFITCESYELNSMRKFSGLDAKDLHITIAFTEKDLFHARKNVNNILKFK